MRIPKKEEPTKLPPTQHPSTGAIASFSLFIPPTQHSSKLHPFPPEFFRQFYGINCQINQWSKEAMQSSARAKQWTKRTMQPSARAKHGTKRVMQGTKSMAQGTKGVIHGTKRVMQGTKGVMQGTKGVNVCDISVKKFREKAKRVQEVYY